MRRAHISILVGFFLTIALISVYKIWSPGFLGTDLQSARRTYELARLQIELESLKRAHAFEIEQLRVKQGNLQRNSDMQFYGMAGVFIAGGLAVMIVAFGHSRAHLRRASVHIARIGQYSEIPVLEKDLERFYPIAVNLSLAEMEASTSQAHDKAFQISRQILNDLAEYTRAFAGKQGLLRYAEGASEQNELELPAYTALPTFADLLRNGTVAPGKPMIFGYDRQGQPHFGTLMDLKSLAVAGWQGSGKTRSIGYLVASSVLTSDVHAYVIDPHKHHPESLGALLSPLEHTGRVTLPNPFDTPALLNELHAKLERRLAGTEVCQPGILLVIDELARLARTECFDLLVAFLERCVTETRKANITFIGASPQWTARYFKGRADIRRGMNAVLLHKMKPSQAELLLEDAQEKHLVKHLHQPGEAVLVTDYGLPTIVSLPLCTRQDMETAASIVHAAHLEAHRVIASAASQPVVPVHPTEAATPASQPTDTPSTGAHTVIPLAWHRALHDTASQTRITPLELTLDLIRTQFERRKAQEPHFTQTVLARQVGISQSQVSRILSGERPLTDDVKPAFYEALFDTTGWREIADKVGLAYHPVELAQAVAQ